VTVIEQCTDMKRLWEINSDGRSAVRVAGKPTTAGRAATKRENKELSGQRRRRRIGGTGSTPTSAPTLASTSASAPTLRLRWRLLARETAVVDAELVCGSEAEL
jgi:hypothetical protein